MTYPIKNRNRLKKARGEEGMVLVAVLLIVTLASMTAVYAVQGAATEIQAASSMKTAMLARGMSDSLVNVAASVMDEVRGNGSAYREQLPLMARYNLPDVTDIGADGSRSVGGLTLTITNGRRATATPTDAELRGPIDLPASGTVSAYIPTPVAIQEMWPSGSAMPGNVSTMLPMRVAITVFGELGLPSEAATLVGDRGLHDTISISQAYYDVVIPGAK